MEWGWNLNTVGLEMKNCFLDMDLCYRFEIFCVRRGSNDRRVTTWAQISKQKMNIIVIDHLVSILSTVEALLKLFYD